MLACCVAADYGELHYGVDFFLTLFFFSFYKNRKLVVDSLASGVFMARYKSFLRPAHKFRVNVNNIGSRCFFGQCLIADFSDMLEMINEIAQPKLDYVGLLRYKWPPKKKRRSPSIFTINKQRNHTCSVIEKKKVNIYIYR